MSPLRPTDEFSGDGSLRSRVHTFSSGSSGGESAIVFYTSWARSVLGGDKHYHSILNLISTRTLKITSETAGKSKVFGRMNGGNCPQNVGNTKNHLNESR